MLPDILPLFFAVILGSAARRLGQFDEGSTRQLTRFVFHVAIPCMLFYAMTGISLSFGAAWSLLVAYFSAAYVVLITGYLIGYLDRTHDHADRVVLGFTAVFSNTVLLGIPLVLSLFGPEAGAPLFAIIGIHSLLLMTPATMMVEAAVKDDQRDLLRHLRKSVLGILSNTVLLSIFLGLAWNATGIGLPDQIKASLTFVGVAGPPIALFCLGATLAGHKIKAPSLTIILTALVKVIVHPALVWLIGHYLLDIPANWLLIGVLLSALPAGVNPYLFAGHYQRLEETVAQSIVYGSIISAITVPTIIIWAQSAGML